MNRRELLRALVAIPFLPDVLTGMTMGGPAFADVMAQPGAIRWSRVRPGDAGWPTAVQWDGLRLAVDGRLLKLESPFAGGCKAPVSATCDEALKQIKNPYYIGDQPALTQSSGWVDAWTSQPSAYAVAAETTADVVAAVNFARTHRLRLVVKGGGHSYQGTSDAPDSLLVWTRHMRDISLHDAFVAQGCAGMQPPQPAVTLQAGAMWIDAYNAVTTHGGRYVQGGGCATVGVAGLIQSGGFGSFSKNYGLASAGLLEAEVVTADGVVRIANACTNADLFWGLKGGGGGSLGVVTRVTLRTRELPVFFGVVSGVIKAETEVAYRALIAKAISFYQSELFNPHWGEQMVFCSDNRLRISMLFQGLGEPEARKLWAPFHDWVQAQKDCRFDKDLMIAALPARHLWDAEFLRHYAPGVSVPDNRAGTPAEHIFWAGDQEQVAQFLHGYKSAWMPASLLQAAQQSKLVDAIFACSREWQMAFHFNKGLAGAPADAIRAAKDTAMNPQVLDAFALAIIGAEGPPAFPGMPGEGPDLSAARYEAQQVDKAMAALLRVAPHAGSYVSESDYFERDWQRAFWGTNYPKLAAVKRKYDPDGLFFVHHGVGSEAWSADGFSRQ